MTTVVVFLDEIKAAANQYLNDTFTKFKNIFRYSSAESRSLATILSTLDSEKNDSLLDAVTAMDTYIQTTGSSAYPKRRFWSDYLSPVLEKLAKNPLSDATLQQQEAIQDLEFAPRSALNEIQKHSGLLYDGMGYDQSAVKRHPALSQLLITEDGLDACRSNLVAEAFKKPSAHNKTFELSHGRILKLFFAQNIPLPNVSAFTNESRKQQPFFDLCLDMMDLTELLILLKGIAPDHPSIGSVLPSFLFKLSQAKQGTGTNGIETECLLELKRLGLSTLTSGQMLSIISKKSDDFFRTTVTHDELTNAIVQAPAWEKLLSNRQGELPLTNLIDVNDAEAILAVVDARRIESEPGIKSKVG